MFRVQRFGIGAAGLSLALLAGCAKFDEYYYVGTIEDHHPTQFYRFHLHGSSSLSKTRYEAGWYDASVVERLFGEIKPPDENSPTTKPAQTKPQDAPLADAKVKGAGGQMGASTAARSPAVSFAFKGSSPNSTLQIFGPEGKSPAQRSDERLVVFMHSDPRQVIQQIRSMVNSEQSQKLLAQLAGAPAIKKQREAIDSTTWELGQSKDEAKQLQTDIDSATKDNIGQKIDAALNTIPTK